MKLRERIGMGRGSASTAEVAIRPTPQPRAASIDRAYQELKLRIHRELVERIDLDNLGRLDLDRANTELRSVIGQLIEEQAVPLSQRDREQLREEVFHEVQGLGPIEPLLKDPDVSDILVNTSRQVYVERFGKLEATPVIFRDDAHLMQVIDRIVTRVGRRIDESSPMVDARLADGSRVNAIIPPLSLVGPVITVRKFSHTPFTVKDLIRFGTATPQMFQFLKACIEARLNLFVSGGTGSGKTTTLNVLSSFIPNDERIVTIEDAAELQLRQEHVLTLESRPPNLEGEGEITIRGLLRNAMHMRPDRIIVGECRAGEALDMLQAMTTGHDGSLSTGHANSPKDMLRRLETMVLMTGYELPLRAIREQIASAVDLIVHTARLKDGTRKIVNITEVYGIEDEEILTQDIFLFEQTGVNDGKIEGKLVPTGIRPTFMEQFKKAGVELPKKEFGIPPEDPKNPIRPRKGRWGGADAAVIPDHMIMALGQGRAVKAGGMVYVSSVGPVDGETGQMVSGNITDHTRQAIANLKALLEQCGSSLEKVVWANWSLKDPTEFEQFNEEWSNWFDTEQPVGQGTLMLPAQRRAGFRITLGVIAEA